MPSLQSVVFGPELYWLAICGLVYVVCLRNLPPTDTGSAALEKWWYLPPLVFLPASFMLYLLPTGAGPWWLLLRLNLAACVGIIVTAGLVSSYVNYPSNPTRNAGVLAGFMIAVVFAIVAGAACNVLAVAILAWAHRKASG